MVGYLFWPSFRDLRDIFKKNRGATQIVDPVIKYLC
jgi:hypothetical protein